MNDKHARVLTRSSRRPADVALVLLALSAFAPACETTPEPAPEPGVCVNTSAAESCGAASSAADPEQPGAHLWSGSFGGKGQEFAWAVALDACSNTYLTGHVYGAVDFGNGASSSGQGVAYVAKLDPAGQGVWSQTFQSALGFDLAADPCGNTVITGTFYGDVDFGGGPLDGVYNDLFLVKLGPDGEHLWSRQAGGEMDPFGSAVAIGPSGEVVLVGGLRTTVNLGGDPLVSAGASDLLVAKLDADGEHVWSLRAGDDEHQSGARVAIDTEGNVIVLGRFNGTLDLGTGALTSTATTGSDLFLAKFDPDGEPLWSKAFGGNLATLKGGLAVDTSGAIYLAGNMDGPIDLGAGTVTGAKNATFVAKLDPDGAHRWSHFYGPSPTPPVTTLAVTPAGEVALAGKFTGPVDFGGGSRDPMSDNGTDMFLLKLDTNGDHLWDRQLASDQIAPDPTGLALDGEGRSVLVGGYYGTVDFGGGPMTAQPDPIIPGVFGPDVFVAKLGR